MAKLALVYGMRLFPLEELDAVNEATITLKNGKTARITMHLDRRHAQGNRSRDAPIAWTPSSNSIPKFD